MRVPSQIVRTEQIVDRHAGQLALDVPQRLVDPGQRVVEHRSRPPVAREVRGLPDVLDLGHPPADLRGREVNIAPILSPPMGAFLYNAGRGEAERLGETDQEGAQVLVDRDAYGRRPLGEGGAADAGESIH